VLRHFADDAGEGEFWGYDIDAESIDWMKAHLCPPFHAAAVSEHPDLSQADEYFDVAWAMSVFTHLSDDWAGWLLELHRVLKPGGYLIVTFMGANMTEELPGLEWDEDRVGMSVIAAGRPWSLGGPRVFHSEWWIRAHWGRAFEIIDIQRNENQPGTQGLAIMRKRPIQITTLELREREPGEARENMALQYNIQQLHAEDRRVRDQLAAAEAKRSKRWYTRVRTLARQFAWHALSRRGFRGPERKRVDR
jgi:SAM-dependent methyltransferase